jgi:hypothetical protein
VLVPSSMRGKEVGRFAMTMGMVSMSHAEYEQVTITESQHASDPFAGDTITVKFTNAGCGSL